MLSINKVFVTAALLCCVFEGGLLKQIPDFINICKRDPNTINDCARHSIEAMRPELIKGIPEIEVPGIDPFFIKEVIPVTGSSNPIRASGKDIQVSGAGNFTIKSLSVDLDTFTIKARVRFPKLHFEGRYKLDTQLLVPITGEGTMTADAGASTLTCKFLVKCDTDFVLHGVITDKDGAEYIEFDKMDMDISIKDYRITLDGLFNGDKVLGEAANQAINQNRGEFLKAAKPYAENTVSSLLLDFANRIVKDLTLDQLLPKP